MAKMKDWLIDVESFVWEAIERGFTSEDDVVAYVTTYIPADRGTIISILEKIHFGWDDYDNSP